MSISETFQTTPKWVWLAGGGLFIGLIVLTKGGGSSALPGLGQSSDLTDAVNGLQDAIGGSGGSGGGGTTGTPKPGPSPTPTPYKPPKPIPPINHPPSRDPGGTSTPPHSKPPHTTPSPSPIQKVIGYVLSFKGHSTPLYNASGHKVGSISSGTYDTTRKLIDGKWHYVITKGQFKGDYSLAEPWFTVKPIKAPAVTAPTPVGIKSSTTRPISGTSTVSGTTARTT